MILDDADGDPSAGTLRAAAELPELTFGVSDAGIAIGLR